MAHGFSNRVWVATSTTGTGDVSIGAAKPAHCTPEQAGTPDGAERTWLLEEGNDFEIYRGAYDDINKTVERGTVILSLIAGVAGTTRMNLAGTATLRIVSAAEDMLSALESGAAGRDILAAPDMNAARTKIGLDDINNLPISAYWKGILDEVGALDAWTAMGGAVNNAGNGYVKLPTGTIIQWGSVSAGSGVSDFTLTYPMSFPTGCRSLSATLVFNNSASDEFAAVNVSSIGASSASCRTRYMKGSGPVIAATGMTVSFIAVGY